MKKLVILFTIIILLVSIASIAIAKNDKDSGSTGPSGNSGSSISGGDSGSKKSDDSAKTIQTQTEAKNVEKHENTYTFYDENQNHYQVEIRTETKEKEGETFQKIKVRGIEAVSNLELEEQDQKIEAKLSNGNKQEIKIMPDTASERAIERLKTNKNLTIQLREVGEGNNLSVVYDIEGNRTVKILGLFKVQTNLRARVDAQTGELLEFETPWWYFLVGKEILVPKCDADNLNLCNNETCNEFGYWYNDSCNSAPEPVINDTFVEENNTIVNSS